jgi:hypothetical protein
MFFQAGLLILSGPAAIAVTSVIALRWVEKDTRPKMTIVPQPSPYAPTLLLRKE